MGQKREPHAEAGEGSGAVEGLSELRRRNRIVRSRAAASITELDEGDLVMKYHNTQPLLKPLFPICKRYTYECTCMCVWLGIEPRSLCWTSVLSLRYIPSPAK